MKIFRVGKFKVVINNLKKNFLRSKFNEDVFYYVLIKYLILFLVYLKILDIVLDVY